MKRYLVDGKFLTEEEVLVLFNHGRVDMNRLDPRQRVCLEMVKGSIPEIKGDAFLVDIGCYGGGFLEAVNHLFPDMKVEGLDYFADNIEIAKLLYPGKSDQFRKKSVYELDYEDDSVDVVILQEVIEHLDRPVDAIRGINRILKQGGYLILSIPNACSLQATLSSVLFECRRAARRWLGGSLAMPHEIYFENVEWNRHIYAWTSFTLNTLMICNGFEYIEHRIVGNRWWERFIPGTGSILIFKARKIKKSPVGLI